MIITISGTAGSGKSSIAKIITKKLHAQRVYVGGMRRELARKKGWTLEKLNEYAQTHHETDVDVDKEAAAEARKLAKKGNVVVEGRTQFHFLPEYIKIFIKVDLNTAAKRIWKDLQNKITKQERNEGDLKSLSEARREIQKRDHSDAKRYIKYYGFDHRDELQYDFVIDTTKLTLEEVTKEIMGFIKKERLVTNRLSAHKVG